MSTRARYLIKFKHGDLAYLRERLLADLSREHFAVLLGKTHKIDGYTIINVIDLLFPGQADYTQQSMAFLRIKKDFIHKALVELTHRYDVDTIIDVHTHPFTQANVSFSATDDGDARPLQDVPCSKRKRVQRTLPVLTSTSTQMSTMKKPR